MLFGLIWRRFMSCQFFTRCLVIVSLTTVSTFAQTFTQITSGPIVSDASYSVNSAWGDYDNDGDLDLFVATYNDVDRFYTNNGDGSFSQVTTGALVQNTTRAYSAAWGDYDNDGYLDLFVTQIDNWANILYHNEGDGTFIAVTSGILVSQGEQSQACAWADYDLDGDLDLLVVNYNQNNALYRNNGGGNFSRVTTSTIAAIGGHQVSWADYDNDGDSDVLIQEGSANRLFRNNGDGSFTQIITGTIPNATGGNPFWGDYDNDGDMDLFIARADQNGLYRNDGGGTFTAITGQSIVTDIALSNSAAWGDFDNNGTLDLYVANSGSNAFYSNNGDGTFTAVTTGDFVTATGSTNGVVAVDVENDGDLDLFVSNYGGENNQYFSNDGSVNHWLQVDLSGDLDNTSGITARVAVKATGIWQTRQILVNDGAPLRSHFGLGTAAVADSVVVDWPQGTYQVVTNQTADTRITLTQNGGSPRSIKLVNDPTGTTNYNGEGIAWGDYDNDGYPDLFVAVYNDVSRLYHNNGNSSFSQVTNGEIVTTTTRAIGAAWGDYDNDGYLDLFVAQTDNWSNLLYHNNTDGTFTRVTTGAIVTSGGYSMDASWMDFDQDGDLDLYVSNWYNTNWLYRNNGDGTFTNLSTSVVTTENANTRHAAWGDYDNDGDPDLFVVNESNNFLYKNNGDGTFTKVLTGDVANDQDNSLTASWGDMDNDGDLDLFVGNYQAANVLYRNNGNGSFTKITTGSIVTDNFDTYGSVWLDIDQDGDQDLYVANYNDVNNALYRNLGNGSFERVLTGSENNTYAGLITDGGNSHGVGVADIDRSGTLDIGVVNYGTTPTIYSITPTGNNWLGLNLTGNYSSAQPVGARVHTYANINGGSTHQVLDLMGQSGANSSSQSVAYIGLGDASNVDSVVIKWPSGMVSRPTNINANAISELTEPTSVPPAFEKLVTGSLVGASGAGLSASWGDYDADGDDDIFIAVYGANNLLYRNNGDGTFSSVTTGTIVTETSNSYAGVWGDYDNDGWLDLFIANYNQANWLYHNDGGTFTRITTGNIVTDGGLSNSAAWGDYDNDGDEDLFVANISNQANYLYRNNGDGTFTPVTGTAVVTDQETSYSGIWGDYDDDGDLDLFVANNGANALYKNNGDGSFSRINTGDIANDAVYSISGAWGDMDNDDDLDLFVANYNDGTNPLANNLYQNNGNGTFTKVTTGAVVTQTRTSNGGAWGDIDNDGDLDLIVYQNDGNNSLFSNQGDGTFNQILPGTNFGRLSGPVVTDGGASEGGGFSDYDSDGDLDLVVVNYNEPSAVYVGNGSFDAHWLTISLEGRTSNRLGTGAKVTIEAFINGETVTQTRQVNTNPSGYGSQSSPLVHFGLGDATSISSLTIVWPSGQTWDTTSVFADQNLQIIESALLSQFEKITDSPIVASTGPSLGMAWSDYDLDGYPDLFVANYGDYNGLYHNSGDGSFTKITTGDVVGISGNNQGGTWGDYDNDGYPDLYVTRWGQNNLLFHNNGDGTFSTVTSIPPTTSTYYSRVATWGDYDNDGDLDLFIANGYGQGNELYINQGGGSFTSGISGTMASDNAYSRAASWCDYDLDGDLDLFIANENGQANKLYRNNGVGGFQSIATGDIVTSTESSMTCSWGDYDNDGYPDLFVGNDATTGNALYHNAGNGTFTRITTGAIVTDQANSWGSGWADYDNDGDLDLLVANQNNNALYINQGDGTFAKASGSMAGQIGSIITDGGNSYGLGWADYDLNGTLDVAIANNPESNFLYKNIGSGNGWLTIRLHGTASNRDGIGAKVEILSTINGESRRQYRQITTQNGFSGQSPNFAWFGLGNDSTVSQIRVIWPSGVTWDTTTVAGNRILDIWENAPAPIYTRITEGAFGTDQGRSYSASWVDYDNDSKLDLFVANWGTPGFLYHNDGDGILSKVTTGDIVSGQYNSVDAAWGDYDNDGDLDLLVGNYGYSIVYNNTGSGNFTTTSITNFSGINIYTTALAFGDYDHDGDLDLFVGTTYETRDRFLVNNGDGTFSYIYNSTDAPFSTLTTYTTSVRWVDYDRDNDLDLFITNGRGDVGDNSLYRNDSSPDSMKFVLAATSSFSSTGGFSQAQAWGDYDNDGDLDLFVANASTDSVKSKNQLYRNNNNGTFTKITTGQIVTDSDFSDGCSWGDFDSDGWLDLFVSNSGTNAIYKNNQDGTFTRMRAGMPGVIMGAIVTDAGNSWGSAFADYDQDGDLDLFVANDGSVNSLYNHAATENSWLVVKARGTRSNYFADGSIVRVKASVNGQSIWQTREITSQSGGKNSNGLQAWFGLGTANRADSVVVIFPNGSRQIATQVTANQTITLTEPAAPIAAFTMSRSFGAPPLVIQFSDNSIGVDANVVGWQWDFGDGETSTTQNPSHTFESEGIYTVRLTVIDANGTPASTSRAIEVAYFTKILAGDIPLLYKNTNSASWGDYDNDGDDDIFIANTSNNLNWLLRNDNGVFHQSDITPFNQNYGYTQSGHWGDIDNDGDLDLLILNTSSYPQLYINGGDGTFAIQSGNQISNTYTYNPYDATWVDYDRDGDLDLMIAMYNGYNILFRCVDAPSYTYEQVAGISLVNAYRYHTSVNFIDYDLDGDLDCFFTTAGYGNYLYVNTGDTAFIAPDSPLNNEYPSTYGQTWGDYDNDGDLDLYLANYYSTNSLYRNDNGALTPISSSETLNGNTYSYTASWVDVNNDGWLDLYVTNSGQPDDYFQNDGDGTFTRNTELTLLNDNYYSNQSVWADYDLNGSMDVFGANYQYNQPNVLHRNNGNSNHWSVIRLYGRESNKFGLNAKIRVKAKLDGVNSTWQIREIGADVGGFGENSLAAHFGLQDAEIIDSLQVRWPSGLVQNITQIASDQQLTVTESSGPPPELDWSVPNLSNVVVGVNRTWSVDSKIKNTGTGVLTYDFTSNQSWMSVSPASGEVASGDSTVVTISIDVYGLDVGDYTGQLTLNTNDLNEATIQIPVIISVVRFSAFFEFSPTSGFAPLTVDFTDRSVSVDYSISQWNWDFGDGSQSIQQNPSHTYTEEGSYTVSLNIVDANSQQSNYSGGPIVVTPTVVVAFAADDTEGGNPHLVHFTDQSVFNADTTNRSWTWDFGDDYQSGQRNPSHTYTAEGSYSVSLTVSDGSNTYALTKPNFITVINYPNFALSRSANDTLDMEIVESDVQNDTLMIYNPGGLADLEFGVSESLDWLTANPSSGIVTPNDSAMIILQYSSTSLGVYSGSVRIYGNDENNTSVTFPVTMHVVEFPYLPEPFRAVYNATGSAIQLTWTDRSRIEDGYKLYKVAANGSRTLLWSAPANAIECTDADVDTNQTWRYAINTFLNTRGESTDAISITVPGKPQMDSTSFDRNGDVITLIPSSTGPGTTGLWAERWVNSENPVFGGVSTSIGSVHDTINFGFAETFRYRVYALGGSSTGSYGLSWPSAKTTLPPALHGDFTGDATVDIQDAVWFVNAWQSRNFVKETGPVSGTAPDFSFSPDGEFNRYDMAAFVGMYRYSASNLSAPALSRLALNNPERIQIQYEPDPTGLTIKLTATAELPTRAMSIWLEYDPSSMQLGDYELSGWNSETFALAASEGQPVNLAWVLMENSETGPVSATVRLDHIKGGKYSSSVVATAAVLDDKAAYQALNRTNTSVVYTPDEFVVESPYPNPFNPTVHVKYGLPDAGAVKISIYDIRGREVATLVNRTQSAGWYTLDWNGLDDRGRQVSTGLYFIRAQATGITHIRKVVYLK